MIKLIPLIVLIALIALFRRPPTSALLSLIPPTIGSGGAVTPSRPRVATLTVRLGATSLLVVARFPVIAALRPARTLPILLRRIMSALRIASAFPIVRYSIFLIRRSRPVIGCVTVHFSRFPYACLRIDRLRAVLEPAIPARHASFKETWAH